MTLTLDLQTAAIVNAVGFLLIVSGAIGVLVTILREFERHDPDDSDSPFSDPFGPF